MTAPLDLSDRTGCQLVVRYSSSLDHDITREVPATVFAAATDLDGPWRGIGLQRGGTSGYIRITRSLAAFDREPEVYLRLTISSKDKTDASDGGDVHVDDLGVQCNSTDPAAPRYSIQDGTPGAAAHVAGIASIVRTLNPRLSPGQIKAALVEGTDRKPKFEGFSASGRVNLASVLAGLDLTPPVATPESPAEGAVTEPRPTFSWSAVEDAMSYDLIVDDGVVAEGITRTSAVAPADLAPGGHTWRVRARDGSHNVGESAQRRFTVAERPAPVDPPPGGGGGGGQRFAPPVVPPFSPSPGRVTLGSVQAAPKGRAGALLTVAVSGAGRLTARATARVRTGKGKRRRTTLLGKGTRTTTRAGTVRLLVEPTAAGRRLLRSRRRVAVTFTTAFAPADGGAAAKATKRGRLARAAKR